jgi:hypothetical protein
VIGFARRALNRGWLTSFTGTWPIDPRRGFPRSLTKARERFHGAAHRGHSRGGVGEGELRCVRDLQDRKAAVAIQKPEAGITLTTEVDDDRPLNLFPLCSSWAFPDAHLLRIFQHSMDAMDRRDNS